jgi:site-specific recombinase XerD
MKKNGNGKRRSRKIPEVLDSSEQQRLFAQLEPTDTLLRLRNRAILAILLNCGPRAAELCALKIPDIDWKRGRLFIRQGKGMKDRVLGLSDEDQLILRSWLDHRPSSIGLPSSNQYLFTDLSGKKPLCGRWLRRMVRRLVEQAGIEKSIHVHSLRHSFASDLLRKTRNIIIVQEALGHASVSTTQIYCHLNNDEVVDAMRELRNGNP